MLERLLSNFPSEMRWFQGKGKSDLEEVVFEHAGSSSGVNYVSDSAAGLLTAVLIEDCDRVASQGVQERGSVSEPASQTGGGGVVFLARPLVNVSGLSDLGSSARVIIIQCDRPVFLRVLRSESERSMKADRFGDVVFTALIKLEIAC